MASFVYGYSGGLGVTLPISVTVDGVVLNFLQILTLPIISGMIAMLPQLGKTLTEFSRGEMIWIDFHNF